MITRERKILSIFFLILSIIPICTNVAVVTLMIKKRQLQRVRFYIIANLSMADTLTLLLLCIGAIQGLHEGINFEENTEDVLPITVRIIATSSYINSLFTTVFLSFDRYTAVRWSLQYETLLTKVKVILVLCFIWIVSILLSGIQWVNVKTYADYHLHIFITLSMLNVQCYYIDFHSECGKIYKCC